MDDKAAVLSGVSARTRRLNVFVKVSGDEYLNPLFQKWIRDMSTRSWVVICIGGGTQINAEFDCLGIVTTFGPLGREILEFGHKQIARDVLERNKIELEDELAKNGIHVTVCIPVREVGEVLCHENGDQMVRSVYLGFDKLYVVTTPERLEKKKTEFTELPKVEVKVFASS